MKKSVLTIVEQTADPIFDLTTVAAVNAALGLTSSTTNDVTVAAQITECSRIIADLCGRVFAMQTVIETFRLHWADHIECLILSRFPVVGDVSVTVDDVVQDDSTFTVDQDDGIVSRIHGHWRGVVAINYTGGYNLPDEAPAPLSLACTEIIRQQHYATTRNPAIRDIWSGENRVSYFDPNGSLGKSGFSPVVDKLIEPYLRYSV